MQIALTGATGLVGRYVVRQLAGAGHRLRCWYRPGSDRSGLDETARAIDWWLITGGRRTDIGAGTAVLNRFHVDSIVIADPDAWTASLRALVQQAQAEGIRVSSANGPVAVDGVAVSPAGESGSWLIQADRAVIAVVPPQSSWQSLPAGLDGTIFTGGGPLEWQGPGQGFSIIQVAANSRDGLPVRALLQALQGVPVYRTDRLGIIELVASDGRFRR